MDSSLKKRNVSRKRRILRVRKRLRGDKNKPRLCINKSLQHLYAQLIDDENSKTIVGIGTLSKELKGTEFNKKSKASAQHLGELIAKLAKEKKIKKVVFDRGMCQYHGLVAEFADAARKGGLQF